jgi:hypothetical protein
VIDVASLVGDIPTTTVTVRTYGSSTISARGEAEATGTDASATMTVHPTGRRELERQGLDASRETISCYSQTAIGLPTNVRPPRILYQTRWYEVVRVADYLALGGICMVHAQLVQEATS